MLERSPYRSGLAARDGSWRLYSVSGVILAAGLYSAIHIAIRLIASLNLGEDDPLDAILSQTLRLGYLPEQPPLYNWAIWALGEVIGPGALRFQLLKYGLLTLTCVFIFLAARRVMKGDAFWAFLSVEALALIYQISWRFHEGFTHAVGAMCAVAGAFWALLRLIEQGRRLDFALFGAVAGLGALTVPVFWVFLASLIAAALLQPVLRKAIIRPRLALSLAAMAAIAVPHYLWLAGTPEGIAALFPAFQSGDTALVLRQTLSGARRAFTEPLMYLAPLIFMLPVFFPGMLRSLARKAHLVPNRETEPDLEQLLLHKTLFCLAALLAGAVLFGHLRYPTHALMPLFLLTSIWLMAQARNAAPPAGQIRRFVVMAIGVAIVALFGRVANMYVQHPVCNICRWGVPYAELADEMKARGFAGGQILVEDNELGGNLLRFFPDSRIMLSGSKVYAPPLLESEPAMTRTAILWPAELSAEEAAARLSRLAPRISADMLGAADTITLPWSGYNWIADGAPSASWRLLMTETALAERNSKRPTINR